MYIRFICTRVIQKNTSLSTIKIILKSFQKHSLSLLISHFHYFTKGHISFQLESWLHTFFQNIELNLPAHSMVYKTATILSLSMIWLLLVSGEPAWFM